MIDDLLAWEGWRWIVVASSFVGFLGAVTFLVAYPWKVRMSWWRQPNGEVNWFGRYLMLNSALIAGLLALVISNRLINEWSARQMVTATLMAMFAAQTFAPYALLMRVGNSKEANDEYVSH